MNTSKKYGISTFFLVLLTGFSVLILGWFHEESVNRYTSSNEIWEKYSTKESVITSHIFKLKSSIGYGGLIHNFKNYVLRGERKYLSALLENKSQMNTAINLLSDILDDPQEIQALKTLRKTLDIYSLQISIIREFHLQGQTVEKIDASVKVSDTEAFEAIRILEESVQTRASAVLTAAAVSQNTAHEFLGYGRLAQAPIILLAALLVLLIRQVSKATKQAEENRKWVDTLLDTAPDAMISVNAKGKIVRSNKMAQDFFGYTKQEFDKLAVEDIIPEKHRHRHIQDRSKYMGSPSSRPMALGQSLLALKKDSSECPVEISLSYTGEASETIFMAAVRDVSKQYADRQQLIKAQKDAADALTRLQNATDALVESEKMAAMGSLVAGIAHEINTPIGIALSSATHLGDETKKLHKLYAAENLGADDLENYLDVTQEATRLVESNLSRSADLISSFKQVAVDQSGGEKRKFELTSYVNEVISSLSPEYKRRRVKVSQKFDKEIQVNIFPGALSQCITNLVMNSLLHAFDPDQEGEITIDTVVSKNGKTVTLNVADNGKGISEDIVNRIFEPFFTTKRGEGGSGLGMHIVYNLATYTMGGDIKLKNTSGGATFALTFPGVISASDKGKS